MNRGRVVVRVVAVLFLLRTAAEARGEEPAFIAKPEKRPHVRDGMLQRMSGDLATAHDDKSLDVARRKRAQIARPYTTGEEVCDRIGVLPLR